MKERHDLLWNTIGYLDEEQVALNTGYYLLIFSTSWIIFAGIAEIVFFSLYNGKFHPFAKILQDLKPHSGIGLLYSPSV